MISPPQSAEQLSKSERERSAEGGSAFSDPSRPDARVPDAGDFGEAPTLDWADVATPVSPDSHARPSVGRFAPGQMIAGRFTVMRYIARGGMGEVYEVEDLFLQGVHIALKVILPEIAGDSGSSRRFEQEVLLARKVTHANLCAIYDIARCDDPAPPFLFLTMKLLTGETLSARLRRPEAIPREEAMAIFRQTVAGVGAIHAAGVIHRDIKPNNVMLDYSGREVCVSIMDFGLARLHEQETTMATRSLVAGTPGYMAPEVLRGDGPSQAADLFALGVLLHQVLTRERPRFGALTATVEPSPALDKADVPPMMVHAVKEFLSNNPERRCEAFDAVQASLATGSAVGGLAGRMFPRLGRYVPRPLRRFMPLTFAALCATFLLLDLLWIPTIGDRVRGVLFSSKEKHIAVLPLEDAAGTPEVQAIGDGLMDSLAGRLSNLDASSNSLWVVPASEVRERKVTSASAALHEFGATLVVRGTFERGTDGTKLTLHLIDTRKTREIGFVDLVNKDGDLAALQDEAVTRLGRLLNVSTKQDAEQGPESSVSRAAFEDYLLGLGYAQRFDKDDKLHNAEEAFKSALSSDPAFAPARARLAEIYIKEYRLELKADLLTKAGDYANQALQADPRSPIAHVALGQFDQLTGRGALAVEEFQRAEDLDPGDPDALTGIADSFAKLGRNSEAEAAYLKAANLRPEDWYGYNNAGVFYRNIGRPYDAIAQYRRAIALAPDNAGVYANLGIAYLNTGDPKLVPAAQQAFERSIAIGPTYVAYANLGYLYGAQHRFAESVAAMNKALRINNKNYAVWNNLAEGYEWLGDEQNADIARSQAKILAEKEVGMNSGNADAQATLALLLAKAGSKSEALDKIHRSVALAGSSKSQTVLNDVADAYELLGDRRQAIDYLRQAIDNGMPAANLDTDPYVRGIVADPAFRSLKKQAGG